MLFEPLSSEFYATSADVVAPLLLGHWLIRNTPEGTSGGPIVEVEAYLRDDPACHAFSGRTERNRAMWGAPGKAYVYFIYGCHYCVNAVCCPRGIAEAVLIRSIEPAIGVEWMRAQRPVKNPRELANGPGKLCAALKIDWRLDGVKLFDKRSALFIARNPEIDRYRESFGPVTVTKRVGISKASDLPMRFYLSASPFVSRKERGPG